MQTRNRILGRDASQDLPSPRVSRTQKKLAECVQVAEKKIAELITSSARKQKKSTGHHARKNIEPLEATNLITRSSVERHEVSLGYDGNAAMDPKGSDDGTANGELNTIFSPAFHLPKIAGEEITNGVDFITFFRSGDSNFHEGSRLDHKQVDMPDGHVSQETDANISSKNTDLENQMLTMETDAVHSHCYVDSEGAGLSSEVSAIYLAMKKSKLECVDEHGQDSMTSDVYVDDDYEEYDDFDPFLFIKNLPDLSLIVPMFRPLLLPKQTRSCPSTTLVLDLDETLVHSTLEPCDDADFTFPVNFNLQDHTVYVRCRPHLRDFMERVSGLFEIIIFTASQSIYAEQLLNVLDPKRKVFRHRVFRESCVFLEGNYLKDLSVLGRDLARVIIIDNSPQAFGFQVDNGIPIESWFDDRSDQELLLLLPFLESLVGVEDVRPLIARKFNLRGKIAAASFPLNSNRRDALEGLA